MSKIAFARAIRPGYLCLQWHWAVEVQVESRAGNERPWICLSSEML
jgi:hypothetical protein